MNKRLQEVRKVVLEYQHFVEGREKTKDSLKKKYLDGDLAKNSYEEQVKDLKNINDAKTKSYHAINETAGAYQEELDSWAILKGEDLTDDLKLLNSPIQLNAEDYEALEGKYQYNYSMLKAIKDHARKNDVTYVRVSSVDKNEKLETFEKFVEDAKNMVETIRFDGQRNYTVALWDKEESFNKLYADTSRILQTGKDKRKIIHGNGKVTWE